MTNFFLHIEREREKLLLKKVYIRDLKISIIDTTIDYQIVMKNKTTQNRHKIDMARHVRVKERGNPKVAPLYQSVNAWTTLT